MGMEHASEIATQSGFSNPGRSGESSPGDCPAFPVVSEEPLILVRPLLTLSLVAFLLLPVQRTVF